MYLLALVALTAIAANAQTDELKATFTLGNGSQALNPRGLFERQYYTCDSGYGGCDAGQCCPLDGGCCASFCAESGEACCGNEGYVYPLDGSECCSDGSHCDPGYSCYECVYATGSVCCYDPAAVASYSVAVQSASAAVESYNAAASDAVESYNAAVSSVNAENSAKWTSYTAAVSEYNEENSQAWASYTAALSSYYANGGGYAQYEYWYTTYWYYIIIWYTMTIATPEITSSSSSTYTVLSAYCTGSYEAQQSWSSLAQSVEADVSYSAVASSIALSSLPSATGTYTYSAGGGSGSDDSSGSGGGFNAAGSLASTRSGVLTYALPILGLMTGVLAVLL